MIAEFIERFNANSAALRGKLALSHPEDYKALVQMVVEGVAVEDEYRSPDPKRIHQIDDGDYQGTLVFVIAAGGYQPSEYWYVKVSYGSCSGCDTLEGIREYDSDPPRDEQINSYMTLATHILQGLKRMGYDDQTGPY